MSQALRREPKKGEKKGHRFGRSFVVLCSRRRKGETHEREKGTDREEGKKSTRRKELGKIVPPQYPTV